MSNLSRLRPSNSDTLARGQFTDGMRTFEVRSSSADAPDSFQVYVDDNRDDIVLVISGLNSGDLKATWGRDWRGASEEWREWAEASAFMAFYNGQHESVRRTRVCNG
ncbi:hypothetical protein [Glycomyces tarimensis]